MTLSQAYGLLLVIILLMSGLNTLNGQMTVNHGFSWTSNPFGTDPHFIDAVMSGDSCIIGLLKNTLESHLLCKADKNGNILWLKKIEFPVGTSSDGDIVSTSDGNFVIVLFGGDTLSGKPVIKFSNQGDILWARSIYTNYPVAFFYQHILATSRGGVILSGTTGCAGGPRVVKLSGNGELEFSLIYSGHFTISDIIREDPSKYTCIGYRNVTASISICSMDTNGIITNLTNFHIQDYLVHCHPYIMKAPISGYYCLGTKDFTSGDNSVILMYLNDLWQIQWVKKIGVASQNPRRSHLLPGPGNGVIVSTSVCFPQIFGVTPKNKSHVFIHVDSTGQILGARVPDDTLWANRFWINYDIAAMIPLNQQGSWMAVGNSGLNYSQSPFFVDAHATMTVYDSTLSGYCMSTPISFSSTNLTYTTSLSYLNPSIDTNVSVGIIYPGVTNFPYQGFDICTYTPLTNGNPEPLIEQNPFESITVFPNPARDFVVIRGLPVTNENVYIKVVTLCGMTMVECESDNSGEHRLDISGFSQGVYFLIIQSGTDQVCHRLVK